MTSRTGWGVITSENESVRGLRDATVTNMAHQVSLLYLMFSFSRVPSYIIFLSSLARFKHSSKTLVDTLKCIE